MSNNELVLLDQVLQQRQTERATSIADDYAFELFACEQALREHDLSAEEIADGVVGGGNDGGLDGIYVFLGDVRLTEWAERDVGVELLKAALAAYDHMIGLDLDDLSVDGSITKSPCGGELSGRSPVDRGKQGTKRSVVTDGRGIPLAPVSAGANRHDSPLYEPPCARSRT